MTLEDVMGPSAEVLVKVRASIETVRQLGLEIDLGQMQEEVYFAVLLRKPENELPELEYSLLVSCREDAGVHDPYLSTGAPSVRQLSAEQFERMQPMRELHLLDEALWEGVLDGRWDLRSNVDFDKFMSSPAWNAMSPFRR